jgi:hypothetical protein
MNLKAMRIAPRAGLGAIFLLTAFVALPALSQTGAYTLSSGAVTLTSLTETAAGTNESGIFVCGSGTLTVGTVNISTSGNSSNTSTSDQYGYNAGILAGTSATTTTKGTVLITGSTNKVVTTGSLANGLFATATGSSLTMLGGAITCSGANAHGIDATYGGSVTVSNVTVVSSNDNSSAVATDYGGGYVTVYGGSVLAADTNSSGHSAGVYSTGVITVDNSTVVSLTDCGGVIDGANSIILTNTAMTGYVEGMKLWKTAPATGTATVIVNGGSLTCSNGDGFYVTGSAGNGAWGTITVQGGATISASSGNLVKTDSRSLAAFTAIGETLAGNFISDSTSTNTIALKNATTLTGCINAAALTIDATSAWNTTSNSVVTTLTNSGVMNLAGTLACGNVVVKTGGALGGSGTLSSNLTVSAGAMLVLNPSTNFVVVGRIIFGGAVTVSPSTTNITAGTYKLLTYGNSLSGTPSFTYSAPVGSGQTAVFSTDTAGVISVTIAAPPATPTNIVATGGSSEVTLAWNSVANASSYFIWRTTPNGGSFGVAGTSPTTNFVNSGLTNGTLYYFEVSATNSSGASPDSSAVSARPTSDVATNVTLSANGSSLAVSWPVDHTGWNLLAQTNQTSAGLSTNWTMVTGSSATNLLYFPLVATNGSVFFRMAHP